MPQKKAITIPNMSSGLALLTEQELSALAVRAAQLPTVIDYYSGWYDGSFQGADNVVLFSRTSTLLRKPKKVRRDYHHRYVLLMALVGAGEMEVEGKPVFIQPGEALMLPPFVFHYYPTIKTPGLNWLFLTFDFPTPRPEHLTVNRYRITSEAASLLTSMIEWRVTVGDERPDKTARRSMALAATLLLERMAVTSYGSFSASESKSGNPEPWLAPVLRRIGDTTEPPPTLQELSDVANLSPSHLRAQFQKRFGISLGLYIRQLRVRQAISMVVSKNLTIGEAAMRSGFSSAYVFSRTAKTILGAPPKDYIERARKGGQ